LTALKNQANVFIPENRPAEGFFLQDPIN